MVYQSCQKERWVITLLPNQSATKSVVFFLVIVAATTLCIAGLWSLAGVWLILPFAGLEVSLLGFLMFRVIRSCRRLQSLVFERDGILVVSAMQKDQAAPLRSTEILLQRDKTRLSVRKYQRPLEAPQLFLHDHKNRLELGAFLNAADKSRLVNYLRERGIRVDNFQEHSEFF